jgi:hypothetical protein
LIPKSSLGVTVWVEVLLGKYLYATPTPAILIMTANRVKWQTDSP